MSDWVEHFEPKEPPNGFNGSPDNDSKVFKLLASVESDQPESDKEDVDHLMGVLSSLAPPGTILHLEVVYRSVFLLDHIENGAVCKHKAPNYHVDYNRQVQ